MKRNDKICKKIMEECGISKRKAEELLKASLFYGDTYDEAKENIKSFYLSKTCPRQQN